MQISLRGTLTGEWTPKCICESRVDWLKFETLTKRDHQEGGLGRVKVTVGAKVDLSYEGNNSNKMLCWRNKQCLP